MDSFTTSLDHEISVQQKENEERRFPSMLRERITLVEEGDNYTWAKPFIHAMKGNDWNRFKSLLDVLPEVGAAKVNKEGKTFLHLAIASGKEQFVIRLVNLMSPESLELTDHYGYTALSLVATCGTKKMAETMVKKNSHLVLVGNRDSDDIYELPVVTAAKHGNADIVRYLYEQTPREVFHPDEGKNGVVLLTNSIVSELFDIALNLLEKYSTLAIANDYVGRNAITLLARKPSAFPSGSQHKLWQQFKSTLGFQIREGKSEMQALQILQIVITEVSKLDDRQLEVAGVYQAVLEATKFGIVEFVDEVMNNLQFENYKDASGRGILLYAIIYRQERVFNLILATKDRKNLFSYIGKEDGNNILHEAAKYNRCSQIDKISGVALQMQRELQWFEEVEKLVPLKLKDELNSQGMTPRDLFVEKHADLVEKGEKWMKETATGCMYVAALIATVMFAAAFTIPGGTDDHGDPNDIKSPKFIFFMIMDAFSLFFSCSSMLLFLAILTSRYAAQDFLCSLPTKLILGLLCLCFSIGTMMFAFCATLFIVLHQAHSWVYSTCTALAGLPITLFIIFQVPLVFDMIYNTYGPSIFDTKKTHKDIDLCC